jgi:hypothetical protein
MKIAFSIIIVALLIPTCRNENREKVSTIDSSKPVTTKFTEIQYYKNILDTYQFEKYPNQGCNFSRVAINPELKELHDLPPDIISQIKDDFKTNNPNFNCKYKIITWGCGTACQISAVFDSESGKFLKSFPSSLGIDYRIDSRILIINPPLNSEMNLSYREILGAPIVWQLMDETFERLK